MFKLYSEDDIDCSHLLSNKQFLFDSLFQIDNYNKINIFDEDIVKWEQRVVGGITSEILDTSVRNSYKISKIWDKNKNIYKDIKKELLLEISYSELDYKSGKFYIKLKNDFNEFIINKFGQEFKFEGLDNFLFLENNKKRKWKVHKYLVDGMFVKHSDTKINEDHIGTLILIPPINYSTYSGGELILYNMEDEDKIDSIVTSDEKGWQMVFVKIGQKHEIKPITEGIRYSFTSPYFINFSTKTFIQNKKYEDKISEDLIEENITKFLCNKIKLFDEEIKKLQIQRLKLLDTISSKDFSEIEIKTDLNHKIDCLPKTCPFIVICENFYENPIPENLNSIDSLTFNTIFDKFIPLNIQFINANIKINAGNSMEHLSDEEWGIDTHNFSELYEYENTNKFNRELINGVELNTLSNKNFGLFNNYKCYYFSDNLPGKFEYSTSEYNDEYYENTKEFIVTLMIVNK